MALHGKRPNSGNFAAVGRRRFLPSAWRRTTPASPSAQCCRATRKPAPALRAALQPFATRHVNSERGGGRRDGGEEEGGEVIVSVKDCLAAVVEL